jgi:phenylpyruvate tautomerase PptA (4-oxalocrotonate tautomerase family)
VDQKRDVAKKITDVIETSLGIDPQRTEIFFHDIPDENYAKAGILLVDQDKNRK